MKKNQIDLITDEGKILLALFRAEEALSSAEISWKAEVIETTVRRKLPEFLTAGLVIEEEKKYKISEGFRTQILQELPEEYHELLKQLKECQSRLKTLLTQALIKVSFCGK